MKQKTALSSSGSCECGVVLLGSSVVPISMALDSKDPIFAKLASIKPNLSTNNQQLVPTLIKLFGDLHSKMLSAFDSKLEDAVSRIEDKFTTTIREKDAEINELLATNTDLREQVSTLDEKLDALNAYSRKDTIIVSGALPQPVQNEASHILVRELLSSKFPSVTIEENDISVAHRLQPKRANRDGTTPPPNIVVKLVRRNVKLQLIKASRAQNKDAPDKLFVNESLTPQRNTVLQTLIKLKKDHKVVKGVTSMQGEVYAYMEHPAAAAADGDSPGGRHRDTRHRINTVAQLKKFCVEHLKHPLDHFIENFSAA